MKTAPLSGIPTASPGRTDDPYRTGSAFLVADAQLSILEVADALQEYEERFGGEAEA